jgi:PAS domain S-box-containing protein
MMVRGIIPLHYLIFKNPAYPIDLTGETIVLFLSFLMLLGMVGIKKIFIARNKVEEGTKRFATLIHYLSKYANDFIVLIDENFHFLEVNERVMDFCGYTHDELIGMNASQLRVPETKNEFINHIKIARIKGRTFYETFHQRKDKASSRWE